MVRVNTSSLHSCQIKFRVFSLHRSILEMYTLSCTSRNRTKAFTSTQPRRPFTTLRMRETVDFALTWFQIVTSLTNQTSVYLGYTSKYIMNDKSLQYNVDCTPKAYALRCPPRKCIVCYMSEIHCLTCWVIHVGCITYHEALLCGTHVRITVKHRASSLLVFCIHCIHRKCYYALHTCFVHNRAKLQFTIYYNGD